MTHRQELESLIKRHLEIYREHGIVGSRLKAELYETELRLLDEAQEIVEE